MFNFKFDFNFILTKVKELVKSKFFWINIGAAVLAIIILVYHTTDTESVYQPR